MALRLTPLEVAGFWKDNVNAERRIHKNHIAIRGNGTSVLPGEPKFGVPGTFYNNHKTHDEVVSTYDRMFHLDMDYNQRLPRQDKQHNMGLDIAAEDQKHAVPMRSSAVCGSRVHIPLEQSQREHVRLDYIVKGFYVNRGTGIPTPSTRKLPI